MENLTTVLLFAGMLALRASAQTASPPPLPDVGSYGDKLTVLKDIAYGQEPYEKLDLYRPQSAGPFPLVICWFGGGFTKGSKAGMAKVAAYLASRGMAAATPGYYLADKEGVHPAWPKDIHDAKASVRFLRGKAAELHLDPARFAALGHSSGAYIALVVALTPHIKELEGDGAALQESSAVMACVDVSGVCDRRGALGTGAIPLLGKDYASEPDLRAFASPILYVGRQTVPIYLLHGDQDKEVDVSSAKRLSAALDEAQAPHELHIVSAGHNCIGADTLPPAADWLIRLFSR